MKPDPDQGDEVPVGVEIRTILSAVRYASSYSSSGAEMGRKVLYGDRVITRPPVDGDMDPDWLLVTLLKQIAATEPRYKVIRAYLDGDPPKPETPSTLKEAWVEFETFRKKSRTNYAGLIVGACVDRTIITGFRTAAKGDEDGDVEAERIWDENDMDVKSDETHQDVYGYGRGFLLANPFTKRARSYRPWQAISIPDSNGDPVAAAHVEHNPLQGRDYAYIWLREVDEYGAGTGKATCHIAVRDRENRPYQGGQFNTEVPLGTYLSRNWVWWKTEETDLDEIPLVEFENRKSEGEFEKDTDVIDRINHMILQRVVIITMQAFRQRAIKGDLPKFDEKGNRIDYDELFPASPGALWLIGKDSEMWESQTTDVQGILNSVKDDVRDLAAVTRTPMTYFSPDAANGSAEGASLQREGYTSKIDDRKARLAGRWRRFMSLMFQINGDSERAPIKDIEVLWTPTENLSMAERYSAATQAKGIGVSLKTVMREVLHYTPKQMRAAELERISETLLGALSPSGGDGASAPTQTPLQRSREAQSQLQRTNGANSTSTGVSAGGRK